MGLTFNRSARSEPGPRQGFGPPLRLPLRGVGPDQGRPPGAPRGEGGSLGSLFPIDPTWLLAGFAMVCLSACTFFLVPEESFAIALGMLILLLAFADLRVAFLAFVLLYPFMPTSWGLDLGGWMPYLTAKRVCCMVLTVMFLVHGRGAWDTPRMRRIGWFLLALLAVQLLVGFGSRDPLSAIKRTFADAVEWYVPFLIAAHVFRTREQVRTLLAVVLISMGVTAILAIVEHSIDYNFYSSFVAARHDIQAMLAQETRSYRGDHHLARRVRVAFSHPIDLGLHLMCLLLFAFYSLRQADVLRRTLILVSIPLFCLAMLYTYSRGPLLGLVCGILWLCLVGRRMRTMLPVMLLGGLGAYLLMPIPARNVLQETIMTTTDVQTGNSIGGGTVRARLNLLRAGLEFSAKNLWFGIGPGEVRQTRVKSKAGQKEYSVDFSSVDNFYLQQLLAHGLIVLALTLAFYLHILWLLTRAAWRSVDRDTALLAAVAASMCVANYVALATVGFNITLFWILLGPAVRACDLAQLQDRQRRTTRRSGCDRVRGRQMERNEPMTPSEPTDIVLRALATVRRFALRPSVASCVRVCVLILPLLAVTPASQAAPGFYGTSGLYSIPTASVEARGAWSAGANYVGREFRPGASPLAEGSVAHCLTMTLLPRLEVGAVFNNYEGKLGTRRLDTGLTPDRPLGGYTVDRMVAMHWQVAEQRGTRPALAVGARDVFGSLQLLKAQYGVASLQRDNLTVTAGLGTGLLRGPFGGVEWRMSPSVTAIAEGMTGQWNGGFRFAPVKNFQLDAALMGFRSVGGGLSYRRRF